MREVAGRTRLGAGLVATGALVAALALAPGAGANNLDKRTMAKVAKQIAKVECEDTKGCADWDVRRMHRVSAHKARGEILVSGKRNGGRFSCERKLVIKLDHETGKIFYGLSKPDCVEHV